MSCGWNEETDANAILVGDNGEKVAYASNSKHTHLHNIDTGCHFKLGCGIAWHEKLCLPISATLGGGTCTIH